MGKTLKTIAMVAVAVAIVVFAPQLTPAFLTAAVGSAAATTIVTMALMAAAMIGMKTLGLVPRPSVPSSRGGTPTMFRQSITDSFIVYGRRRVGGLIVFFHAKKDSGDHYRYFVIALAGHQCAGNVTFMLNDDEVTVDGSGMVTNGKYADAAWLWFQRGLPSGTANATFVAECGGKWTTDHKGNGVAAIYAKFQMTDDVVAAGMPNITVIMDGKDDIFDPRDDSTGYTNNAALVFYDWMQIPREEGGFGAYVDEIPDDDWISAQANVCDETVGGEVRYALDGIIVTGAPPNDIRDALITNCAGSFTYTGGKFLMRPGYYVPPSVTLTEDDLAGAITVSPFMSGDMAANEVHGTYVDPGYAFQGQPFNTQRLDPEPTDIRQMDIDLAYVTSRARAERVAHIMLMRAQYEKTVVWPMNIMGIKVQTLDTVQLDSDRYGLSNYAFTVLNWGFGADFSVVQNLREENADIYTAPTFTEHGAIDTIEVAEVVTPRSETSLKILSSFVTDADPADGLLTANDTQITIEGHTRTYSDKSVSVTGDTIGSLTSGTRYHVYYDDETRAGGAVDMHATTVSQDATNTPTNPYRHYVGTIVTDTPGGSGTSSGGQTPPGWDGPNYNTP